MKIAVVMMAAMMVLVSGSVVPAAETDPPNPCLMIPEIYLGPSAQKTYQPESCIVKADESKSGLFAENAGQAQDDWHRSSLASSGSEASPRLVWRW